jgi:hypothetical protein
MFEIKDLLNRFSNILSSGEAKKFLIKEAVYETTGIQVSSEKIKIKNNIIFLEIKPILKNEIYLKKEKILQKLAEKLGGNKAHEDIR